MRDTPVPHAHSRRRRWRPRGSTSAVASAFNVVLDVIVLAARRHGTVFTVAGGISIAAGLSIVVYFATRGRPHERQ